MTKREADPTIAIILSFLRDVAANNNRPWFQANKARYDEAREAFDDIARRLIAGIAAFDPSVAPLTVKDCTYRFYRDIRFSQDKSPYKRHFGCYVDAMGKKSLHGGYYFHLQPDECMTAGGCWWLPTNILNVVRETIVDNTDAFRSIVEADSFKKLFPTLTFDPLKVMPRGVPRDYAFPQYVKCRNYCVSHPLPDDFFKGTGWMDEVLRQFEQMKPFMDFVNDVVDDYI
jgi:uncharacterized protein (TIGR02453 family)